MMNVNLLLSGVVGSHAYGLAGPDSDVDSLGVYAVPTSELHGLHPPVGKTASIVRSNPDEVLHEAGKFANLCLGGNPTLTELLWLEKYEVFTPLGERLIQIRSSFLSAKRVRDAYFSCGHAQFRRLLDTGQFQSKQRKRVSHARHMLRLLDQGFELYTTGQLTIRLADPQRYIDFGEAVSEDSDVARNALREAEDKFDQARTVLPERPDEKLVERWLHNVRHTYYRSPVADDFQSWKDFWGIKS